jgi:hypothetical protein
MIRPVPFAPTQLYGENPTRFLPWDSWLIQTFGNYQPDGHTGEDYPCPAGTPVRAVTSGVVRHVGYFTGSYADNPWWISPGFAGFTYVVDHGWFIGIYGHCMDGGARVKPGQQVSEGQVLGLSGNTGASTGDHLHFEALPDGYVLNSYMYGRLDPTTLFGTSLVTSGSVTTGTTTSQSQPEGFLMALTDKQQEDIYWMLCAPDGREYLAELVGGRAASKTLNTTIKRQGSGLGGETSLAAFVAWNDAHVEAVVRAVAAVAPTADLEAVKAAVREGLAEGVNVTATVTVEDRK